MGSSMKGALLFASRIHYQATTKRLDNGGIQIPSIQLASQPVSQQFTQRSTTDDNNKRCNELDRIVQ